jgi:hypothetical protein
VKALRNEEEQWKKFERVADEAWRARTRLERGDFIAAEPLLERLFAEYRGQQGATAAVVAEGLLRCRLRRAAHVAAIEPWLGLLRAGPGPGTLHAAWASEAGLPPVLDEATKLVPALPPIWLNWRSVEEFAKTGLTGPTVEGKDGAAALADIYLQAARFEAGAPAKLQELNTTDPAVNIAWRIVQGRVGNEEQREEARKWLQARIAPTPASGLPQPAVWLEVWCRAGIGRSLLRESALERRQQGVIELLQIPARFARAHPYLAGIALAEAAVALQEMGDAQGAGVLAAELAAGYPGHPVNDWAPIRDITPKPDTSQAIKAGKPAEAGQTGKLKQ